MPISIFLRWFMILERVLLVAFAMTCSYIVYFMVTHNNLSFSPELSGSAVKPAEVTVFEIPPYEIYAVKIKKRDLFSSSINSSDFAQLSGTFSEGALPSNLKVVGIILGKPVEVVLEDTALHQTIFIKQGQINNNISIEKVDGQQLILNYQGQQVSILLKEKP